MTKQQSSGWPKKLLILPPLIVGVGVAAWLISGRSALEKNPIAEVSRTLRVIAAPQMDVVPRVIGYGTVEPGQTWKAVAEVQGRVAETNPNLKPGAIIKAGEVLLRIDPRELELVVSQLKADIDRVQAQLAELRANEANYKASLKIEDAALALAEQELRRLRQLASTNAITDAEVDAKQREVLAQRQAAQAQRNLLNVLPSKIDTFKAELAVKKSSLQQAEIDLAKSVITAPFNCRIADVDIQVGQFLNRGEVLFEAYSTALVEIDAQLPMDQARKLISGDQQPISPLNIGIKELGNLFGVEATVRVQAGDLTVEWDARFAGIREQIDPATRSVAVVVAVDHPYQKAIPGRRPPLVKGMFCEVELRAKPQKNKIVIPRAALHEGFVYVVNRENRLEKREIVVEFMQGDFVCVKTGLQAGESVVVSDPTPAIEGMLVDPVEDESLLLSIQSQASGEGSIK